jgi:endonuclease-3
MSGGRPRSPKGRARVVADRLAEEYPGTAAELCALDHANPYELLVATILSAQTTDERVNLVTPAVFAKYPRPADLVTLPGVGRKTGNVVRSVALGEPGLPVDTHVLRLSRRLGLTRQTDPVKVELELNPMVRADERGALSLRLILHGRRVCMARAPRCDACVLADICPSAFTF